MELTPTRLDELVADCKTAQDVEKLYAQMLRHVINRSLASERQPQPDRVHQRASVSVDNGNSREAAQAASRDGGIEALPSEPSLEPDGGLDPSSAKRRPVQLVGRERKILTLYLQGMSVRDIEATLLKMYGATIPHSRIVEVTDALLNEAQRWQTRPLQPIYPIVWLDSLMVKVQCNEQVVSKTAHVALGIDSFGDKEVLGLWLAESEGTEFWSVALTELKQRGVQDIYIASVDWLRGLPEAVSAVFPQTLTQTSIAHLMRASLHYVSKQDNKAVVAALKAIYQAATAEEALRGLQGFEAHWGAKYTAVMRLWRGHWVDILAVFKCPPEVRKVIHTAKALESLNTCLRRCVRNRPDFANDEAALKMLILAAGEASKNWKAIHHWKPALQSLQLMFGEERAPLLTPL